MTMIYIDAGALMVAGGAAASGSRTVSADAARMVSHLLTFGHKIVLLGDRPTLDTARATLPMRVAEVESLGDVELDAEGWLVSDSPELCAAARSHRRLRTVLVGGPSGDLAHRPADRMARSLSDAVLDILATETMPEPGPANRDAAVAQPEAAHPVVAPDLGGA